MLIKSKTDVITNSSTEVYTRFDNEGIDRLKKVLSLILKLAGDTRNVDDVFTITKDFDMEDLKYRVSNRGVQTSVNLLKTTSKEKLVALAEEIDESEMYCAPLINGITVESEDPKYQEVANRLSSNLFDSDYYCS